VDGITFDSKAEARRYGELKMMREGGLIHNLRTHPRYVLLEPFTVKGIRYRGVTYVADFAYIENGQQVVEDVKGKRTAVYNLKEKLFMDRYGDKIELRIVEA
jgi:hypothetical protein